MNLEPSDTPPALSTTPPTPQAALPPTPPGTVERPSSKALGSIHELKRQSKRLSQSAGSESDEIIYFATRKHFIPHQHLGAIERSFRRVDCYPASICARMPSPIHELVIAGVERSYTEQRFQRQGKYLEIILGRSSRVFLDEKRESRQPDIQFRHKSKRIPGVIIEVAHTQPERDLEALAYDYILKTDGTIKSVYGIDLNPIGKSSSISEWRARLTPSDDPHFDTELRVEKIFRKEFREADGSLANAKEFLEIRLSDFGLDADEQDRGNIRIPFSTVFECYSEALQMEARSESDDEAKRPSKRIKRIGRTPSPIEQLKSDDEAKFQTAEEAAELVNHSDFEPSTDEGHDSSSSSQ